MRKVELSVLVSGADDMPRIMAKTKVDRNTVTGFGDTDEEALKDLNRGVENLAVAVRLSPPGYPRTVEVDW